MLQDNKLFVSFAAAIDLFTLAGVVLIYIKVM